MKRTNFGLLAIGLAAVLFGPSQAFAAVTFGSTVQTFAVLGGSTVTNTGSSVITGNVGVSPGPILQAAAGFPPGLIVGGTFHANDGVAGLAQNELTTASRSLPAPLAPVHWSDLTGQDLGGLTLTPGVYCFTSSAQLTGTLTLNLQGNPNAFFLFQIGSTLTTAPRSSCPDQYSAGMTVPTESVLADRQLRHSRHHHVVRRKHSRAHQHHAEQRWRRGPDLYLGRTLRRGMRCGDPGYEHREPRLRRAAGTPNVSRSSAQPSR